MSIEVSNNKRYLRYNIVDDNERIFNGYLGDLEIDIDILRKLSRDLGFSYDIYKTLNNIDTNSAATMVSSMSKKSQHPEVLFLIDDELKRVISYSLEYERTPVLNSEFIQRVHSLIGTSDSIEIGETHYYKDDTLASVIIKKVAPITVEEKYEGKDSKFSDYDIGVLIVNDESNSAYSRLVLYVEGQPLYLPASYYNTTTSRYKRSTSSSVEALEVLVLKVIDDLREDNLQSKLYDFHYRYRANKNILASYEEYNTVLRTMRKIPTIIEDSSYLESLISQYEKFEEKYNHLEDQRSSYIWRCTALSDFSVGALVSITSKILSNLAAPPMEYFNIRDLLGAYISTNRIAEEIAKESID